MRKVLFLIVLALTAQIGHAQIFGTVHVTPGNLAIVDAEYLSGLDNSFAGTHWAAPREISAQLKYRFRY
jgi:hypothetical protein